MYSPNIDTQSCDLRIFLEAAVDVIHRLKGFALNGRSFILFYQLSYRAADSDRSVSSILKALNIHIRLHTTRDLVLISGKIS